MSEHVVDVSWSRGEHEFTYQTYNRDHEWRFDGGVTVPGSANPAYLGNPGPVDPEEAFIASLSSCHMLTFLAIAAKKRLVVDAYDDHAVGVMAKNERGRIAITQVTLHPKIVFAGEQPDAAALERIHHRAHEECFIANSVTTEIIVA
ncbi:OsmC family protein [Kribbella italica]|uniref:Organic hydroperoxide reductase OsmC/OhrA n=1 Tax=Kribbella italica TaxID=1540520 RepID=A0A7W9JF07_9ACTN|nr:organic hydroperoxide reductase OsmC/OhrA [Kribbella italica]